MSESSPVNKKSKRRNKRSNVKPNAFQEFEQLAKEILEGQDISYAEWLHTKHQEVVLEFNISKKNEIVELAREDDK